MRKFFRMLNNMHSAAKILLGIVAIIVILASMLAVKISNSNYVITFSLLGAQFDIRKVEDPGLAKNVQMADIASKDNDIICNKSLLENKNSACVARGHTKSVKRIFEEAQKENIDAQYNMGLMHYNGWGVAQDYEEAATWLRRAIESAKGRHPAAQYRLGTMYIEGKGVEQNYEEAVTWLRRAENAEHPAAQFMLGVMYDEGKGVPQDDVEAVQLYKRAAKAGHVTAQLNLGAMYYKGEGVAKDYRFAYMWSSLAAAQGLEGAEKNRNNVASRMKRKQLDKAQKMAKKMAKKIAKNQ